MKNEYKITKEEMVSWAKKMPLRGINIVLIILWGIVGLIGISLFVVLAQNGGKWISWLFAVYCVFASIFKIFFERFIAASNRYKMLSKTFGVPEWTRTIEFTEEEIILTDHTSLTRFQYHNVKEIIEKESLILLVMNNRLVLPLYKNAFVESNWETCKERIASKR